MRASVCRLPSLPPAQCLSVCANERQRAGVTPATTILSFLKPQCFLHADQVTSSPVPCVPGRLTHLETQTVSSAGCGDGGAVTSRTGHPSGGGRGTFPRRRWGLRRRWGCDGRDSRVCFSAFDEYQSLFIPPDGGRGDRSTSAALCVVRVVTPSPGLSLCSPRCLLRGLPGLCDAAPNPVPFWTTTELSQVLLPQHRNGNP